MGSFLEDFYIDIFVKKSSAAEGSGCLANKTVIALKNISELNVYKFEIYDLTDVKQKEIEIGKSVTIVLQYTDDEVALQGWTEDTLAVYYYKPNINAWVKLGGTDSINKVDNTITIKASYLHETYAIFGSIKGKPVKMLKEPPIVWPNPFTPGRGGDIYGNLKVSCIFKEPVNGFKFNVYDTTGRIVYTKEYTGLYSQAEIYWDGKVEEGGSKYGVKSGIYIFQIEANGQYYRGKVMIAK